jgi:histidinol dehydrogenase
MRIIDYSVHPEEVHTRTVRRRDPDREIVGRARMILDAVRDRGDAALIEYTRLLDCPIIESLSLRVSKEEIGAAYEHVDVSFREAVLEAIRNISRYHRRQKPRSWELKQEGMRLQQRFAPLRRIGMYVPGGKAAYPSTVLMNAIPAAIAGVGEIVMTTPCNAEGKILPEVLVAANECGVKEIYRIGGAQAVGALAYGTESIRPVDKITGPGNAYVAAAKQLVFGIVGIDMIAGPTEVVVIADDTANPVFVAADLIAQAEHDELASPVCITTSMAIAQSVSAEVERQLEGALRRAIARPAFEKNGFIVVVKNLGDAVTIANGLAPEHLEIIVQKPAGIVEKITNAGAIFVGEWSTEALGDYMAGPNHTLPTSGTARFSSALSVFDFMKFTNIVHCTKARFMKLAPHIESLAGVEGLDGHAASVRIRRGKQP